MEFRQLSYFLEIAQSGSFSKAAVRLSVAQPILSRQIKLLESELGVELLYRNGRGIVLSEVGKLLESYAHSVVKLVGQARSEIDAMRLTPQGQVAIAMPPSIGWVLTGPLVLRCRKAFPNIAMHVVEGFSGHVAEWLSTGRVDIGIVYQAPRLPTLATEPLFSDELILLGAVNDPAGLGGTGVETARLAEIPMILPARPHGLRVLVDNALAQLGVSARVELEVDAMPPTSTQRPMSIATRLVTRLIRDQVQGILRGHTAQA